METEADKQIDNVVKDLGDLHVSTPSEEGQKGAAASGQSSSNGLLPLPAPANDPATYTADPTNYEIKHPLQNRWTLWYDNPKRRLSTSTWCNNLKQVVDFDTVEDFWRVYNNILPASGLEHGSNYHLFKVGIEPKWECPANSKGGQWVVVVPSKQRGERLDKLWLYAVLACIGEAFEEEDEICGCVVSVRKAQNRVAIWTKTASREAVVRSIGLQFKRALELPSTVVLGYQVHSDSMKVLSTSSAKHRYEL